MYNFGVAGNSFQPIPSPVDSYVFTVWRAGSARLAHIDGMAPIPQAAPGKLLGLSMY